MPWKIIIALALITATFVAFKYQAAQMQTLEFERDLVRQHLDAERTKTLNLTQELAGQYQIVQAQQSQIRNISAAHDRAAQRNRILEDQNARANRTLQQLKTQNQKLADWAADLIPAAADDWLRSLSTGTDHHHAGGADQPATAAQRTDSTDTNPQLASPAADP